MHVISKRKLREFWVLYPAAQTPLEQWHHLTAKAAWQLLAEVLSVFPPADVVGDCTVFNIGGNKYRLIVSFDYVRQVAYVKHVLTHKEYDQENWKKDC